MQLYLIRHGQSHNNAAGSAQRVCDPPLTEAGEQQAALVAQCLKDGSGKSVWEDEQDTGYGLSRLYCSPMLRAMQTTEPIAAALGIRPEVWPEVHEEGGIWLDQDGGKGPPGYPGLTRDEMQARFPDYTLPDGIPASGWWNRPKETETEWRHRAAQVAVEVRRRFGRTDERIGVVTHGGFSNHFLHALFCDGAFLDGFYFSHYNTAISRIDYLADDTVRIRYLNRIEHLPPDLVT